MSHRVVFLLFVLCALVAGQNLEGTSCTLKKSGASGICTHIANCSSVLLAAYEGVPPQVCETVGTVPIVCCDEPSPYNTCPPLPKEAVKAQLTGYKTWDYCVKLADSLYPCKEDNGRWMRGNICPSTRNNPVEGPLVAGEYAHWARFGTGTLKDISWSKGCMGSLISEEWVLTGGYCLHTIGSQTLYVGLGAGSEDSPALADIYGVKRRVAHPDFKPDSLYHSVALVQLDQKVTFTSTVFPACLHTGTPLPRSGLILGGWDDGNGNSVYRKYSVDRLSHAECDRDVKNSWFPKGINESTQMCFRRKSSECVGGTGPIEVYNGDRVGCTHMIVAVTSMRAGSCRDYVTSRVSPYIQLIEGVVWPDS